MIKTTSVVSIIIPNWNGKTLLGKNLESVLKASENSKNRIKEIIVVDDKSTDDSLLYLRTIKNLPAQAGKKLKIVSHKVNRGFSKSINTGVRSATGEYVCLLNTDVIPEQNFLESVIPHFKDKKVFAVSLHESGYGYARAKFIGGFMIHSGSPEKNTTQESLWASGGSAVFRRSTWIKLKGFDEDLFSPFYWEDVDLGYRAHKRGYTILWEPKAKVVHQHESVINSNNFKIFYLNLVKERNYLLFTWKNITSKRLFRKHINGLTRRVIKHPGFLKVIIFSLLKLKLVIKKRKEEQRESIISDEAIFEKFGN